MADQHSPQEGEIVFCPGCKTSGVGPCLACPVADLQRFRYEAGDLNYEPADSAPEGWDGNLADLIGDYFRAEDVAAALQDREAELEAKREEAIRIMREQHAPYPAELAKERGEKAELEKERSDMWQALVAMTGLKNDANDRANRAEQERDEADRALTQYAGLAGRVEEAEHRANRAEAALREARDWIEKQDRTLSARLAHNPGDAVIEEARYTYQSVLKQLPALDTSIGDREPEKGEKHDWKTAHFGMHWKCQRCGQTLVVHGEVPPPTFGCKPPAPCSDGLHPDTANQILGEAAGIEAEPSSSNQDGCTCNWDTDPYHSPECALNRSTQPAVPVPSGASGDWPPELTVYKRKGFAGMPTLDRPGTGAMFGAYEFESRRYVPAETEGER